MLEEADVLSYGTSHPHWVETHIAVHVLVTSTRSGSVFPDDLLRMRRCVAVASLCSLLSVPRFSVGYRREPIFADLVSQVPDHLANAVDTDVSAILPLISFLALSAYYPLIYKLSSCPSPVFCRRAAHY
jgi:hypothetical protein